MKRLQCILNEILVSKIEKDRGRGKLSCLDVFVRMNDAMSFSSKKVITNR